MLMAEAYEQSFVHGQLAVSYVVEHYCPAAGLHADPMPLSSNETRIWELTRNGLTIDEQMTDTGFSFSRVTNTRRTLYGALRVANWLAAARLAYEIEAAAPASREVAEPPDINAYDAITFDLYTRGVSQPQIAQLTGEFKEGPGRNRLPRVYEALDIPDSGDLSSNQRDVLAVDRMYAHVLTPRLSLQETLDDYPDLVDYFEQTLGPNEPFANPPEIKRYNWGPVTSE